MFIPNGGQITERVPRIPMRRAIELDRMEDSIKPERSQYQSSDPHKWKRKVNILLINILDDAPI